MLDDEDIGGERDPRLPSATAQVVVEDLSGGVVRVLRALPHQGPAPWVAARIDQRAQISIEGVLVPVAGDAGAAPPWFATAAPPGTTLRHWLERVALDPGSASSAGVLTVVHRLADLGARLYALDRDLPSVFLVDAVLGDDGAIDVGYLGEFAPGPRVEEHAQLLAFARVARRLARHDQPVTHVVERWAELGRLAELRASIESAWAEQPELRADRAALRTVFRRVRAMAPVPDGSSEDSGVSVELSEPRGRPPRTAVDAEPPPDPWLGTTVGGGYHLRRLLGIGATGRVYEATADDLDGPCAVKVVHCPPDGEDQGEDDRLRFERGARAMSRLHHPNVVTVHAVGVDHHTGWLAMEFVPGPTLAALLRDEELLSVEDAVAVGRQLASALAAAHAQGVIHRDLKPANVLVCERRPLRVKLADFGLARPGGDAELTREGILVGTPLYMSPEQCYGHRATASSDLYALGILLYRALAGRTPFEDHKGPSVLLAHTRLPPPPLSAFRGEIPAALQRVVDRCLQKDPDHRFPDARSLEEALARSLEAPEADGEPVAPTPPQSSTRGQAPIAPSPPPALGRWAVAVGLGTVAVAAATVAAAWFLGP